MAKGAGNSRPGGGARRVLVNEPTDAELGSLELVDPDVEAREFPSAGPKSDKAAVRREF